jgi:hypothetical protein
MKPALRRIFRHLAYYRESYLFPAIAVGTCWLAIRYVIALTGRAVIDDPGVIVAFLFNFIGLVLVLVLVGSAVPHFIGDAKENDPWWKHFLELCAYIFFSLLFAHYLFR